MPKMRKTVSLADPPRIETVTKRRGRPPKNSQRASLVDRLETLQRESHWGKNSRYTAEEMEALIRAVIRYGWTVVAKELKTAPGSVAALIGRYTISTGGFPLRSRGGRPPKE